MLLHAVKREPRSFIVPGVHLVDVEVARMAAAPGPRRVGGRRHRRRRAGVRGRAGRPPDDRQPSGVLPGRPEQSCLRPAERRCPAVRAQPANVRRRDARRRGRVAGTVRYHLFGGLHQFSDLGGPIVYVVAALPLGTVMALAQTPLDRRLVFAEAN